MRIETGTTSDRRNRILILLVMCVGFSTWFAYDGFVGYPAKNMEWARQFLPPEGKQRTLHPNPRATVAALEKLREVVGVGGVAVEKVTAEIGEPAFRDDGHLYYIGPAAFASFEIRGDRVVGIERIEAQTEPSESDIRNQKALALILAVVAVGVLVHLVRISRERVVLDDEGLKIRGQVITWDEMESIDGSRLQDKGWVTLTYQRGGQARSIRLDSFSLDRFEEILNAIREKKGFHLKTVPEKTSSGSSA